MKSVTPSFVFFAFLVNADHYLSAWQVLKKSVRGNFWAQTSLKGLGHAILRLVINSDGVGVVVGVLKALMT